MDKLLLRIDEAADALGLKRAFLYRLLDDPEHPVPSVKIGRARRVPADGLRRWVSEQEARTGTSRGGQS